MEDKILANAQLIVQFAREKLDVNVSYDEAGVRWLDEYIEGQQGLPADTKARLLNTVGSYLGECIRQTYGGRWTQDEQTGNWGVWINERLTVFPFSKAQKHLDGGDGDSVLGLFTAIPSLLNPVINRHEDSQEALPDSPRPWWKFWDQGE